MTGEDAAQVHDRGAGSARGGVAGVLRGPRRDPFLVGILVGLVLALITSGVVAVVAAVADSGTLEEGPLVILSGRDDSVGGQRQSLINEWNALHPKNQASIVELPPIADAQRSEMLARAQSHDPGVAIFNLDVTWTAEFAQSGYIRSLDETQVPTDGFLEAPLSTCRYDGKLWALPFNTDVGLLYYRTDLLAQIKQSEPPRTWASLVADAQQVRAQTDVAGYIGQTGDYEGLTVTALETVWGAGGTVVDDDGHVLPDERDGKALADGVEWLRTLAPPGVPALDETAGTAEFRAGHALFMRNWPVAYRTLTQPTQEGAPPPFAVTQLPGGSAALGGQNLAVSADTPRPRAARALIQFLTSDRSEQRLLERGGLPATRAVVYEDAQLKASPLTQTLRAALEGARHRPTLAHYAEFSQAFRSAVDHYLHTDDRIREDALRSDLEAALDGRWPPVGGN